MDAAETMIVKTALPVACMAVLSVILPYVFVPRNTRSHKTVTVCIMGTALCLVVFGAILTNLFDARNLDALSGMQSLYAVWLYLRESLYFMIVWVPLLGLVWFNFAQRVERLRGEDIMREG